MRARLLLLALLVLSCGDSSSQSAPPFPATGYYGVTESADRWWLVDPDGHPFYSVGLNHVSSGGYKDAETGRCPYCETMEQKYGSVQGWRDATTERMLDWGFNTIGAWSDREGFDTSLAQTPILNIGSGVADYFSSDLEARAADIAARSVRPYRDDPTILGWFLANEMHWGPDWRGPPTLLDDYLELPEGAPGREVAESYRGDPDGFLLTLASRYFEVATRAVRAEDQNHLILGVRASTVATPPQVVEAAGPWLDVFSINHYDLPESWHWVYQTFTTTPTDGWLSRYHELSGLPLMITEFTYRARESDVPNTYPPIYYLFDTQQERGEAYRRYAQNCYEAPYIVGHHWFEYFDDPPGGRSDGEDSNFGLVSNADVPYADMVAIVSEVNAGAPHRQ